MVGPTRAGAHHRRHAFHAALKIEMPGPKGRAYTPKILYAAATSAAKRPSDGETLSQIEP
jgi:hypothetical protein